MVSTRVLLFVVLEENLIIMDTVMVPQTLEKDCMVPQRILWVFEISKLSGIEM